MSITVVSPKSNYITPDIEDGVSDKQYISWQQDEGTQTAYEIMYKLKNSGIWSTTGRIESNLTKHPLMDIQKDLMAPFEEIYYKVKVFTEDHTINTDDGSSQIDKSVLTSDTYAVIFKSGLEVSHIKVFDGQETLSFPVYDEINNDNVDNIKISVDSNTGKMVHLPIVDKDSPIAGDVNISTGDGEIKRWANNSGRFDDHVLSEPESSGEFWGYYAQNYANYSYAYRYEVDHYDVNYQYAYKAVTESTYAYEYAYGTRYDRTDTYYYNYVSNTEYNTYNYTAYAYRSDKETGYEYYTPYSVPQGSVRYVSGRYNYSYYVPGYIETRTETGTATGYYYSQQSYYAPVSRAVYATQPIYGEHHYYFKYHYGRAGYTRADYMEAAYRYISGYTTYVAYSYITGYTKWIYNVQHGYPVQYQYESRNYISGGTATGTQTVYQYKPEYYTVAYNTVRETYYYYRDNQYSYTMEESKRYNVYSVGTEYVNDVQYYYQYTYQYDLSKIYRYTTGYDKTTYNYSEKLYKYESTYYTAYDAENYNGYRYYSYQYKYSYYKYTQGVSYTEYASYTYGASETVSDGTAYPTGYQEGGYTNGIVGYKYEYPSGSYPIYGPVAYSYMVITGYYYKSYQTTVPVTAYYSYTAGYSYAVYGTDYTYRYDSKRYYYRYTAYRADNTYYIYYRDVYKYYAYSYFYNELVYIRYQYVSSYTPVYYNQKYMYITDSRDVQSYYYYKKSF